MSEISTSDEELESLMAELEAQNEAIMAVAAPPAPVIAKVEPVVVVSKPEPKPELVVVKTETEKPAAKKAAELSLPWEDQPPTVARDDEKEMIPLSDADVEINMSGADKAPSAEVTADAAPLQKTIARATTSALLHYIDVDAFMKETRVSEVNLDQCMIEQSAHRAYYGANSARAEAQASRVKAKFEVVEATLYDHHRKELAADPTIKVTEKAVENAVKLDPRWLKAKNLVIEGETIASINKAMVDSLRDRKDMIVQLGADRREEGKGQVRVMKEQAERDDLRARVIRAAGA